MIKTPREYPTNMMKKPQRALSYFLLIFAIENNGNIVKECDVTCTVKAYCSIYIIYILFIIC